MATHKFLMVPAAQPTMSISCVMALSVSWVMGSKDLTSSWAIPHVSTVFQLPSS